MQLTLSERISSTLDHATVLSWTRTSTVVHRSHDLVLACVLASEMEGTRRLFAQTALQA